jgi:hypothetical protein
MTEEQRDADPKIAGCVARLKSIIPPMEHGALESRLDELLNDPSTDTDAVISILLEEFDPKHN